MVKQLKKHINKIIVLIIVLLSIMLSYFSLKPQQFDYQTYYGLDVGSITKLNDSIKTDTLQKELEENPSINEITLKNNDVVSQKIDYKAIYLNNLVMNFKSSNTATINVTLKDEDNEVIYQEKHTVNNGFTTVDLLVNSSRYDVRSIFTLEFKLLSDDNTITSIYNCTYPEGTLKINGETKDTVLLMEFKGEFDTYKKKIIVLLMVMIVISLITLMILQYKNNYKLKKFIEIKLLSFKHNIWYLVWQWLAYLALFYVFLRLFNKWYYSENISLVVMFIFMIGISIYISGTGLLFNKFKNNIPMLFLLIAIPVGLTFIFLILPENIPDENVHFAKAYLTSTFNFTNTNTFEITSKFNTFGVKNYNDILPAIFSFDNYQSLKVSNDACAYNFILYLAPGLMIFIARTLSLSIYAAFYLGRMANFALFLFFAYNILKIVPVGKWLFFVYFFNPMLLQQAISYSADSLINSVCLLAIAYFIKLKFSDDKVTNKDIIIIMAMIGFILVTKFVYLPLFGIYFLVLNKVIKINKQQVLLMLGCLVMIAGYYLLSKSLNTNTTNLAALDVYTKENHVDQTAQIQFLLSSPTNIFKMLFYTLQGKGMFYLESFVGLLGWLAISLNKVVYIGFYALFIIVAISEKRSFKPLERIWIALVGLIVMFLVILGLYLQWTTVGTYITEGVQGRYFIPCIVLILLALPSIKDYFVDYKKYIIPISVIILNGLTYISLMRYFI